MFRSPATGIFSIGISMVVVGLSILLGIGIKKMAPKVIQCFKDVIRKLVSKLNMKK